MLFDATPPDLRDEALTRLLTEADEYLSRCEKAHSDAREALEWADGQHQAAAERAEALRNEFMRRRTASE